MHSPTSALISAASVPVGFGKLGAEQKDLRSRFHHPLSYCCPATIFRDILAALFGRLRAGSLHAHGQDEGLLLDRPVNVPVPSMRVPPTEPGSPGSLLVMIAMVGLRKQLLRFWGTAL